MDEEQSRGDRNISVHRDAISSAIVSGNGNKVIVYHYHLEAAPSEGVQVASQALGANPYRGLASFQVEDAEVYFGRESQVQRLWNHLRDLSRYNQVEAVPTRFLPVLGPSGSGKSSLVRAGLLPELAHRPLPGFKQPRVVVMTPGSTPLESLAVVLARIVENDATPVKKTREFLEELKLANTDGQYDGLRRIANAFPNIESSPLILLIDQFEEVYSLCKKDTERHIFIENLLEAATTPEAKTLVIATLRSDFLGETQQHQQLNQIIGSEQSVIIPAMSTEELRKAIAEPAKHANHSLDEAIIDLLIEQTKGREGALPLLQFTLTQIWEGIKKDISPNTTLKSIGGVGGALAGEAQRLYEALKPNEQNIAKRIFIGLVELGEGTRTTRRRIDLDRLKAQQDDEITFRKVLRLFSEPGLRLITLASDSEGRYAAEVTHEALFEHWKQLRIWIDEGRNDIYFQRRLDEAATFWLQSNRPEGSLWRSPDLDLAKSYYSQNSYEMSSRQIEFFQASIQAQLKAERRTRRTRYAFISLGLLLTVLSIFAQQQFSASQFQTQFSNVIIGGSTDPESFKVLPKALQIAKRQADDSHVDEAIKTYKAILRAAENFINTSSSNRNGIQATEVERIQNTAEERLAQLIETHFINQELVRGLEDGSLEIGEMDKNTNDVMQFENQYKEGALRRTYRILMREPGLGLDEDDNGRLDIDEIIYLPCDTLQKLEDLWRELTNGRCGFYGDNFYSASDCKELSGETLSFQIFHPDFDSVPAIEERIQLCQLN